MGEHQRNSEVLWVQEERLSHRLRITPHTFCVEAYSKSPRSPFTMPSTSPFCCNRVRPRGPSHGAGPLPGLPTLWY